MTALEILVVSVLGGLIALDAVTVAQLMISRPIVAATVAGTLCGSPESGLIIGAVLEMLAMETMPFGASRYLEWSSGAVAAAVFVAKQDAISAQALLAALLVALATAWLAGSSMVPLRRLNGALVARRRERLDRGEAGSLALLQAAGVTLDFVRGALIVFVAAVVALPAGRLIVNSITTSERVSAAVVVALPTAVAIAAAWRMFASGTRRRMLVIAGAVLGVALVAGR